MGQLVLDGALTAGPSSSADGTFPGTTFNEPLFATPNPKVFGACTGVLQRNFNSPGAFVTLSGVGAADTVQKGDTLYFKANAVIKLRITTVDPEGGADLVSTIPVYGSLLIEVPITGYLKLVEAKGVGTIVYMASGSS